MIHREIWSTLFSDKATLYHHVSSVSKIGWTLLDFAIFGSGATSTTASERTPDIKHHEIIMKLWQLLSQVEKVAAPCPLRHAAADTSKDMESARVNSGRPQDHDGDSLFYLFRLFPPGFWER